MAKPCFSACFTNSTAHIRSSRLRRTVALLRSQAVQHWHDRRWHAAAWLMGQVVQHWHCLVDGPGCAALAFALSKPHGATESMIHRCNRLANKKPVYAAPANTAKDRRRSGAKCFSGAGGNQQRRSSPLNAVRAGTTVHVHDVSKKIDIAKDCPCTIWKR